MVWWQCSDDKVLKESHMLMLNFKPWKGNPMYKAVLNLLKLKVWNSIQSTTRIIMINVTMLKLRDLSK